jgi:phosphoribosylformimino-5-aminoimidazole carboxamide ribotide isomerase
MNLIPAIDLRNGRCVRLLKGDFERETRYDVDPVELGARYRRLGAAWLHVVDLDGAAAGAPTNLAVVEAVRNASGLKIQFGGGVRSQATLDRVLGVVDLVVIGSLAVTQPEQTAAWLNRFGPERLTLALDVKLDADGTPCVATHGWTRESNLTLEQAIARYLPVGVRHVLCTDIDKDGAMAGPNFALYRACVERWPELALQASGGVRNAADLTALAQTGVAAAVAGKALLEGKLTDTELRSFLPGA